jgi:sulfite exporter TauE/SafE
MESFAYSLLGFIFLGAGFTMGVEGLANDKEWFGVFGLFIFIAGLEIVIRHETAKIEHKHMKPHQE